MHCLRAGSHMLKNWVKIILNWDNLKRELTKNFITILTQIWQCAFWNFWYFILFYFKVIPNYRIATFRSLQIFNVYTGLLILNESEYLPPLVGWRFAGLASSFASSTMTEFWSTNCIYSLRKCNGLHNSNQKLNRYLSIT